MHKWLETIQKAFPELKQENVDKTVLKFDIIENIDDTMIKKEAASDNGLCFSWKDEENSYIMAVIGAEPCSKDEVQDKLEIVFDKMFGDTSSELYAARHVIIDDMYGLEVLGGNDTDDAKYDIFYGLYLTDGKESYVITGFGDDEVEFVFEKLTGASRLFNRKSEPALISKGKSNDKEIKAVRKLASKLYIDFEMNWQILNCTFSVHDGRLDTGRETSFLMLSEKGVEEMDFVEIYNEDKTFNEEISDLLSCIDAYDISGFTVTLFKDGRYGITYYPVEEDEFNEEDEHDHNHDHCHHEHYYDDEENDYFPEHGSEKEYALNYMNKLHADILSPVEKWDNGMVIIQNTENFTMVYPYYNTGSNPFIEVNIIEDTDENLDDESYMEELGTLYGKYYPAMYDYFGDKVDELDLYTVMFYFKNNGLNQVENLSVAYKEFEFDVFCAVEDGDDSIWAVNLTAVSEIFDKAFAEKPLMYLSFEAAYVDKLLLPGSINGLSSSGEEMFDEYISLTEQAGNNIIAFFESIDHADNNKKGIFTIFPNGKIGVKFI